MIRIIELAKLLKTTPEKILVYLRSIGAIYFSIHKKIQPYHEKMVRDHFDYINQNNPRTFSGFEKNSFTKSIKRIVLNNKAIDSFFTDHEVKNLCSKAKDSTTRNEAKRFVPYDKSNYSDILRFNLHKKSMDALNKYGGYLITFILRLNYVEPSSKFKQVSINPSDSFFPDFYFILDDNLFMLRLLSDSEDAFKEKGIMIFDTIGNPFLRLNYSGSIKHKYSTNFTIGFNVFVGYVNGHFKVNSGGSYTHCDICKRKLEDPISINLGRGPICRLGSVSRNCHNGRGRFVNRAAIRNRFI